MVNLKRLTVVLLVCVLVALTLVGCGGGEEGITLEQFEQVTYGMSESEVRSIFGEEGMLISSEADVLGEPDTNRIYGWSGRGGEGFATIRFINGRVMTRNQTGLE